MRLKQSTWTPAPAKRVSFSRSSLEVCVWRRPWLRDCKNRAKRGKKTLIKIDSNGKKNDQRFADFFGWIPSWELTYPFPRQFWRWVSFSQGGICDRSLEGSWPMFSPFSPLHSQQPVINGWLINQPNQLWQGLQPHLLSDFGDHGNRYDQIFSQMGVSKNMGKPPNHPF